MVDLEALKRQVKLNCNISDARYWGFYSICGLLMRLRSLYRSEKGMKPWESIPMEDIGPWIEEREALWRELETEDFKPIELMGEVFNPFSFDSINAIIEGEGLIYGSGYGVHRKPTFFLAELDHKEEILDFIVYYLGREHCRDLFCSPAMLQGRCIFLRRETALGFLWERLMEVQGRSYIKLQILGLEPEELKNPLSEATTKTLEALADKLAKLLLLHEIGEVKEDDAPDEWLRLIAKETDRKEELYLRAVKDIIADTSEPGPLKRAIEDEDTQLLCLYILSLDPMRRELFPEVIDFYKKDPFNPDWDAIKKKKKKVYDRFKSIYMKKLRG
ncbi:MAG: hypothetical protein D6778_01210 [Nitrospirae bacterium]|nr:MAG: hypothetical protein D6778_01210 [Nitrospirota bacterium]